MISVDHLKELIASGDFDKVENLWTDLITERNIGLAEYFEISDALKQVGELKRACLLLELLGDHYETQRNYSAAIEVQKHMLRYRQEDLSIRKRLIELYRKQHPNSQHLEEYLELSGLSKSDPIMKAMQRFEEFLKYDVGNYFYFERYGMGKIVEVIPQKREIVVDFEKKNRHFLDIDVARGLLSPVNAEHFLYKKNKELDDLKSLASSQPVQLVVMILQSFREPLSAPRIKGYLEGIIDTTELNYFWGKIRKDLEKNDNVRVAGRTNKTYTYVGSAAAKQDHAIKAFNEANIREKYLLAEEYLKKMPEVFNILTPRLRQLGPQVRKEHPGIALDILMLFHDIGELSEIDHSTKELLNVSKPEDILNDMASHEHQARLLLYLKEKYPDEWLQTAKKILLNSEDFKLLDSVADNLKSTPHTLEDINHKIFAMPKQYTKQYLWMLKRIEAGALAEYLKPTHIPRLIDTLEYISGIKAIVKKILSLEAFDTMIANATENEASRIRKSLNRSAALNDYEKKGLLRIIEHHFPDLFEKKYDIIYTTAAALKRKKEELNHILSVDIPANKKEIGRAREFGDLSENFEYKAAKEKQDQLYEKVKTIESELQKIQLIESLEIRTDRVEIGTAITLRSSRDNSFVVYRILGRWDTDLAHKTISNEAPLARAMLGKKRGDSIEIEGIEYEIAEIGKAF
ncbi:hypothetical protein AMJ83_02780 [candidate division WOR_3 bacterium SM23_42]|uniref:Transcription elongation factor GreA n=1 Tax=candidate division WOR_3 bacterium SM23_42 TaxID=1703779 RepID=A0A0S8FUJ1_UNCW3|nr:MAG: hypothetical protein AMJ83_02780 [candidate division WOR_3 bacterium SM23_42]